MEVRLIDANALLKKLKQNLKDYRDVMNEDGACATLIAIKEIENAPTLDYEPVVHGHWIEDNDCQICSNCGEEHSWAEYRASYCEDCGAKMDKEVKE